MLTENYKQIISPSKKAPHQRGFYHLLAKDYLLVETCTPGPIVELMVMLFK